jgi:hypothetical protein
MNSLTDDILAGWLVEMREANPSSYDVPVPDFYGPYNWARLQKIRSVYIAIGGSPADWDEVPHQLQRSCVILTSRGNRRGQKAASRTLLQLQKLSKYFEQLDAAGASSNAKKTADLQQKLISQINKLADLFGFRAKKQELGLSDDKRAHVRSELPHLLQEFARLSKVQPSKMDKATPVADWLHTLSCLLEQQGIETKHGALWRFAQACILPEFAFTRVTERSVSNFRGRNWVI